MLAGYFADGGADELGENFELRINPDKFQNDMSSIESRDDVLTLLVHLGYLSYDPDTKCARVPNEEVRGEIRNAVEASRHAQVARIMRDSMQLVEDVLAMDEDAVAAAIQRAHDAGCSPRHYNNEQALRGLDVPVLLVGITYDAETKRHKCQIREMGR